MSKVAAQRRSVAKGKGSKATAARTISISPMEATANAIVTPVSKTPAERGKAKSSKSNARRTLFPASAPADSSAVLVSPQPKKGTIGGEDDDTEFAIMQRKRKSTITARPPAKRRLIFGKLVSIPEPLPNVRQVYKIVNKLTGSLGGNGYSGPIYGELTMGSMQKMIDLMMEHTHLNEHSRFIDVGSGIGKPNLHVSQYPGVEFSCGVEMEHTRWSLGMTCLKAILDEAQTQQQQNITADKSIRGGNCMFLHHNILEAKTFDPFTHVYMFSIGFPPPLWTRLSEMWNKSGRSASPAEPEGTQNCEYLICYHGPKAIIEDYEFDVELMAQMPTSMHGSKEGHMGYIYKRMTKSSAGKGKNSKDSGEKQKASSRRAIKCDPLFQHSFHLVQQGLNPLHEHVSQQLEETLGGGRRTRRSTKRVLTRASGYE
ncbi:unnamed protein product [Cylindrotheca closterium]|uniref:DOT1 domain-containing protein n=1 Tax=Cylindrotheca closterium TaxID=2856 RepID=A0AAD2CUK4_9STRA|nr:unnamed protein product [Cylindrotheca closterium]